jgi:hypothetical protein
MALLLAAACGSAVAQTTSDAPTESAFEKSSLGSPCVTACVSIPPCTCPRIGARAIYQASAADFRKATERVYRSRSAASFIEIGVLP